MTEQTYDYDVAEAARVIAWEEGLEPGLFCYACGTCWNRVGGLHRLADVDCPNCHAIYSHVAMNREP